MRFSICIPTYEMRGKGVRFLGELFESLRNQTFQDFEVIISDHSKDNRIEEFCKNKKWHDSFSLIYIRNEENRGDISANRKNATDHAKGDVIKPLDQDDFLYDKNCLEKIDAALVAHPEAGWGKVGYIQTDEHSKSFSDPVSNMSDKSDGVALALALPSITFYKNKKTTFSTKFSIFGRHRKPIEVSGKIVAIRKWPFQAGNYVTARELKGKARVELNWRRIKPFLRKIKHRLNAVINFFRNGAGQKTRT